PSETMITLPDAIKWDAWRAGTVPPHSSEMATLYGGLDQPGPYLVLMKWYAPQSYATDPLSLVLSGTWWGNTGSDFDSGHTVPGRAGGLVRGVTHTSHCDGVKPSAKEPVVIGIFGIAPVHFELVDASKPGWRRV